jgi:hypothetical protein
MFQFPGFAFIPYVFRNKYLLLISASPKIAEPELGRRPASAHPECASRSTSSGRLLGITEIEGGFPHSEILGSKPVRGSPRLIAAYHVLHRLSAPRHPPDTLMTLDCSHNQGAGSERRSCDRPRMRPSVNRKSARQRPLGRKDQFCFKHIREPCGQARPTTEML